MTDPAPDARRLEDVPPGARKIIEALVWRAVARCYREGIPLECFYAAMREEQARSPRVRLTELTRRVFLRLATWSN